MFSDVVMELPKSDFEKYIDQVKAERGVKYDAELDADDLKRLVEHFKEYYKEKMGVGISSGSEDSADGIRQGCIPQRGIIRGQMRTER